MERSETSGYESDNSSWIDSFYSFKGSMDTPVVFLSKLDLESIRAVRREVDRGTWSVTLDFRSILPRSSAVSLDVWTTSYCKSAADCLSKSRFLSVRPLSD